ncbi:RAxF-45 family protein [Anaerobacillus sp. 1_MG-2023]|nr:RAxF-45 family protein [Anaerobacillus sp. 1_MG-2023]MDO6654971.1 RAxF-45 family protein [Anaerobacillus sp. 1_MG-2023]
MSNAFVRTEFMDYVSICRAIFHEVAAEGTGVSKNSNFIGNKA